MPEGLCCAKCMVVSAGVVYGNVLNSAVFVHSVKDLRCSPSAGFCCEFQSF